MPLSEFIVGPGKTQRQPLEIMTRLELDALPGHGAAFEKVGHRRSMVISTVCLAALVKLDRAGLRIEDARIAIGAVGPVPERLDDVENFLTGQAPTPASLREAAEMAVRRVRSRSRQAYRREVLVNFVERALVAALAHWRPGGQATAQGGRTCLNSIDNPWRRPKAGTRRRGSRPPSTAARSAATCPITTG